MNVGHESSWKLRKRRVRLLLSQTLEEVDILRRLEMRYYIESHRLGIRLD